MHILCAHTDIYLYAYTRCTSIYVYIHEYTEDITRGDDAAGWFLCYVLCAWLVANYRGWLANHAYISHSHACKSGRRVRMSFAKYIFSLAYINMYMCMYTEATDVACIFGTLPCCCRAKTSPTTMITHDYAHLFVRWVRVEKISYVRNITHILGNHFVLILLDIVRSQIPNHKHPPTSHRVRERERQRQRKTEIISGVL